MDRIAHIASEFGLGEKTGIGVNPEAAGRVPTRAWYALHYRGQFRLGFTHQRGHRRGRDERDAAAARARVRRARQRRTCSTCRSSFARSRRATARWCRTSRRACDTRSNVRPENLARVDDALYAVVNDPKGTVYPVRDPDARRRGKDGDSADRLRRRRRTSTRRPRGTSAKPRVVRGALAVASRPRSRSSSSSSTAARARRSPRRWRSTSIRDYERIQAVRAGRPPPKFAPAKIPKPGHDFTPPVVSPPRPPSPRRPRAGARRDRRRRASSAAPATTSTGRSSSSPRCSASSAW